MKFNEVQENLLNELKFLVKVELAITGIKFSIRRPEVPNALDYLEALLVLVQFVTYKFTCKNDGNGRMLWRG